MPNTVLLEKVLVKSTSLTNPDPFAEEEEGKKLLERGVFLLFNLRLFIVLERVIDGCVLLVLLPSCSGLKCVLLRTIIAKK